MLTSTLGHLLPQGHPGPCGFPLSFLGCFSLCLDFSLLLIHYNSCYLPDWLHCYTLRCRVAKNDHVCGLSDSSAQRQHFLGVGPKATCSEIWSSHCPRHNGTWEWISQEGRPWPDMARRVDLLGQNATISFGLATRVLLSTASYLSLSD